MWNQEEDEVSEEQTDRQTTTRRSSERPDRTSPPDEAIIGDSIRIQGEVSGDEDLTIQGRVEGSVELDQHSVTVGPDGEVQADVEARVITVEGEVTGDLTGEEQVIVRSSAQVQGDISAPRVVLEDGAHFRGGVEMEDDGSGRSRSSGGGSGLPAGARRSNGSSEASDGSDGEDTEDTKAEDDAPETVAA